MISLKKIWIFLLLLLVLTCFVNPLYSAEDGDGLQTYIMDHLQDADYWSPLPFHLADIRFDFLKETTIGPFSFTNGLHATMLLIGSLFLFFLFVLLYKKPSREQLWVPTGITNMLESLVIFVRNEICINYLGEKDGKRFAPLFLNFFFFILVLNIMGLIPFFSTATANINITAGLALITLSTMIIMGIARNGVFGFIKLFAPSGVPFPVLIILFPIEIIGFFVKPFALTIRLFANMFAGHLVIFSIIGLVITFGLAALPALFLGLFIYLLEILVAFLQAYIFTMLSAMFVGEMLHPHH